MNRVVYYIFKKQPGERLPTVCSLKEGHLRFKIIDEIAEGPYSSKRELRKKSLIYNSIRKEKHKQQILANKNIDEISEIWFSDKPYTTKTNFADAWPHIVGEIKSKALKGGHIFSSQSMKIVNKIEYDKNTGVWSAEIKKYDKETNGWILKQSPSTFFPTDWNNFRVFLECSNAFKTKKKDGREKYVSRTPSGVKIIFFINKDERVKTFYPVIENPISF